jgi:hypothetical protein
MAGRARKAGASLDELVRLAPLIVGGTVRKLGAASMPSVPVTSDTAVVRVDVVLRGPPELRDIARRDITVQLRPGRRPQVGARAVFFATSWLYGESIAVVEVGRMSGRGKDDDLGREIADAELRLADERLAERIAAASLVVSGRVEEVAPARVNRERMPQTEHDPDWWVAEVAVQTVERGRPPRPDAGQPGRPGTLPVLFPRSADEMWIDAPKFQPGQEGVWILQRDQKEKGWPILRVPGYTALDPLDFQLPNQLDRVRALVRRVGR